MKPGEYFDNSIEGTYTVDRRTGIVTFRDKGGQLALASKPYGQHGLLFSVEDVPQPRSETGQPDMD